jgi:hypothetical protein
MAAKYNRSSSPSKENSNSPSKSEPSTPSKGTPTTPDKESSPRVTISLAQLSSNVAKQSDPIIESPSKSNGEVAAIVEEKQEKKEKDIEDSTVSYLQPKVY